MPLFSDMNRNNLHIERSIRYHFHTFVEELSFFDLRNFNISRYGSLIVNILFVNFIRRLEHPMTLKRHRAQIANRLVYELKSIKIQIFQNERQSVKYSIQSKGQKSSTVSDHFPINREREEDSKRANRYLVSFLRSSYFRPKMVNPTKSQGKLNNMRNITYRSKCSIGAFMCVTCACLTQNISPKLKWTVYRFHLNLCVCVCCAVQQRHHAHRLFRIQIYRMAWNYMLHDKAEWFCFHHFRRVCEP